MPIQTASNRIDRDTETAFQKAVALANQGQMADAEKTYRSLLRRHPHHFASMQNLAVILMTAERHEEAIQVLRKALNQVPNSIVINKMLAWALHNQERHDEALDRVRRMAALYPKSASAHSMLARILTDLGRHDEALLAQNRAIELEPGLPYHYYQLGDISKWKADDPRLATLEGLLQKSSSFPLKEQVCLNYALGKAYSDRGDIERAFRYQISGGALQRQILKYDETFYLDLLKGLAGAFDREWLTGHLGVGEPSTRPVFVLGMPRSGTTLTEQILASHPEVRALGERQFLNMAYARVCGTTAITPAVLYQAAQWSNRQLRQLGAAYLEISSRDVAARFSRTVDKLTQNFRLVGLVHAALPNARFIHTIRDPIDTCLSMFSLIFSSDAQPFSYDLGELGRYYSAYEKLMAHWHSILPPGVMIDVKYEDVVDDLEGQAHRIVAHCGLDWDDACLSFYKTDRPIRTSSHAQVRQPIYRSSVGKPRPPRELMLPLLQALGLD
jgi:tetratricopeptide (TPR) repeat protein